MVKAKCNVCNMKLTITEELISKCSCNNIHCKLHRLPEEHKCSNILNIIQKDKNNLSKLLVKVEGEKLIKI